MNKAKNSNYSLEHALFSSKFMLICQLRYEVKIYFRTPEKS